MAWKNFRDVIRRELDIWSKRSFYVVAPVAIMVIGSVFYLTFLRDGLPSDIPVAVVDYDNSSVSRNFIRNLDATQTSSVVRYSDFAEARRDMQRGKVSAVCFIPEDFCESLTASRQPKISVYVNALYFVGGTLTWQNLLTMINLTSGAVQMQLLDAHGVPKSEQAGILRPINIDAHKIGNTLTSYNACLSTKMLPGTLQMIIILFIIYSLGTELKYSKSKQLMETAGGSILVAVGGKLVPYTIFYTIMGVAIELILYVVMKFPLAGSLWAMMLDMFLFIIACESAAVLIISLVPICRFGISLGALYSVLSISLTGFTLPVEVMPRFLQGLSNVFPLRHYYLFETQVSMFGCGFSGWWEEMVCLLCFTILPLLFLPRLKSAYINQNYPKN